MGEVEGYWPAKQGRDALTLQLIDSGNFSELYDKWFGERRGPPMLDKVRNDMIMQSMPE